MALQIEKVLDVLRERGIEPEEQLDGPDVPGIGEVQEGETIYSVSLGTVLGNANDDPDPIHRLDDDRLNEWWREIEQVIETGELPDSQPNQRQEPPEPNCAWYCPIHFFGHSWGIYIRESCILSTAVEVARFVNWHAVPSALARRHAITLQLLRSAFYVFFLHEQFHHKIESLGFRFLIASGTDRYRPYKANVYRRSYRTSQCLEESLANAESFRRLSEARYTRRHEKPILDGLRNFLRASFPWQPPGYAEAVDYLEGPQYRDGLYMLQSQVLDGTLWPTTPALHWTVAPKVITALMNISDEIYVVLPRGARPIFRPTLVDPGVTVSSRELVSALTKHHGYEQTRGGKGSHIKLTKPSAPNIHIPGNKSVVSPGVVKHVLNAVGGYPISRLPDLIDGELARIARTHQSV